MSLAVYDACGLLMRHGPLVIMLSVSYGLRRSLGAWPVLLCSLGSVLVVNLGLGAGLDGPLLLRSFLDMSFGPTLLFLLARRQVVPGLRRGRMSDAERLRWLAKQSFSTRCRPADPTVVALPTRSQFTSKSMQTR